MLATENVICSDDYLPSVKVMISKQSIEDYLGMESEASFELVPHDFHPSSPPKLCKRWSGDEVKILIEFYPTASWDELCKVLPNRTKKSIERKGRKMSIKRTRMWNDDEIEILRLHYPRTNRKKILKLLPKRTWHGIFAKARGSDIKRDMSYLRTGRGNAFYGRIHSEKTRNKISERHHDVSGDKNPNWAGGASFEPYSAEFTEKLKNKIRERDGHCCRLCGKLEGFNGRKLTNHHIDYDKQNCVEDNLISLCASCNSKVNKNRTHWTEHFQRLLVRV